MVFEDAPSTELALPADGMALAEMLATVKLVASRSEAVRLLKSGGVYVNNVRATDERARLTTADAIGGTLFVLRKGRKDHHIVKLRAPLSGIWTMRIQSRRLASVRGHEQDFEPAERQRRDARVSQKPGQLGDGEQDGGNDPR